MGSRARQLCWLSHLLVVNSCHDRRGDRAAVLPRDPGLEARGASVSDGGPGRAAPTGRCRRKGIRGGARSCRERRHGTRAAPDHAERAAADPRAGAVRCRTERGRRHQLERARCVGRPARYGGAWHRWTRGGPRQVQGRRGAHAHARDGRGPDRTSNTDPDLTFGLTFSPTLALHSHSTLTLILDLHLALHSPPSPLPLPHHPHHSRLNLRPARRLGPRPRRGPTDSRGRPARLRP